MRLVLCLLLNLAAAPAWADWVKVIDNDVVVIYIDPATIRKDGNIRRVWELYDLKQRDRDGEMSRRVLYEYDCKEERYRFLSLSAHSEPMAGGRVLNTGSSPTAWDYVAPGTVAATKMQFVCAK
jgi:hypothetical protein